MSNVPECHFAIMALEMHNHTFLLKDNANAMRAKKSYFSPKTQIVKLS